MITYVMYVLCITWFRCLSTGPISEEDKQNYADQLRDVRDSLQAIGFSKDVSTSHSSSLLLCLLLFKVPLACWLLG